jgi:hypothetical protein
MDVTEKNHVYVPIPEHPQTTCVRPIQEHVQEHTGTHVYVAIQEHTCRNIQEHMCTLLYRNILLTH